MIARLNKPLESSPWNLYKTMFISEWRIQHGVEFWKKYGAALRRAELTYGVPASIIVATIGIETRYGEKIGEYRVMDSLTNIAFSDSSRAKYFRSELEQFLLLTREQHINPFKLMGSYAGAIGQPQFMPTSYRYYAVNFSKSGTIDLVKNEEDVIGSIANYYKQAGWKTNAPVAEQADVIGQRFDYLNRKHKIQQPLTINELATYGVVPKSNANPDSSKVRVIVLESRMNKEYWLGYNNFAVIKRYNPNDLYAMAVYQLSNYIVELKERLEHA